MALGAIAPGVSHVVLELRLGVERLRRRGGHHRRRGRRRGASGESGQNGAGAKDAKAFGHLRSCPRPRRCAGDWRIADERDSINSIPLTNHRSANAHSAHGPAAGRRLDCRTTFLAVCSTEPILRRNQFVDRFRRSAFRLPCVSRRHSGAASFQVFEPRKSLKVFSAFMSASIRAANCSRKTYA